VKLRGLTRNLGWKVLSVGIAFALWWTLSGARELTTSMTAPVQYRNIPKDLEISSEIVERVHLVVRGPAPLLTRLNGATTPVVLDLSEVDKPGTRTFTLGRANVNLPAGVELERTIPGQVQLKMEMRLHKEVPVEVRFEGEAAPAAASPAKLVIAGPKSRVEKIDRVRTDPVELGALQAGPVKVVAATGDGQVNITTSPVVTVRLEEKR